MNLDYTRLIKRLEPEPDGESAVRHRSAVVHTVNADGTVDLTMSGVTVPAVSVLDGANVGVGDTVQVAAWAGDLLVLGRARQTAKAGGVLGYAQVTGNTGGITTGNVTIASIANVILPANRWIRMVGTWRSVASTVGADRIRLELVMTSIRMEQVRKVDLANNENEGGTIVATWLQATALSGPALLRATRQSGTGTFTVIANATAPASVTVEDLGSG